MFILFIFFPMIILKMYSQNDETGILEVLENKISFAAQLWWEDLYRILQKNFCVFYNSVVVSLWVSWKKE